MKILVINPGSTSTKIAVFNDETLDFQVNLSHNTDEINKFEKIIDQYEFRMKYILEALDEKNVKVEELGAIVGRGGLLKPIEGGTYLVNDLMLEDIKEAKLGEHASNLGACIALEIAKKIGVNAYIADPVVVDEMEDISRISGIKEIDRVSIFHALNQKAVARKFAKENNKEYKDLNLIVAHLGGGISVGAHEKGRVVDVNNALNGDGPFSPERSGGLPVSALAKLCYSGKYTLDEIKKLIKGKGGLVSYLGTNDAREVSKMIEEGNKEAELIYKAMAYQISKEIGQCAVTLNGNVDGIILTGGIAYDKVFTKWIIDSVSWIKEVTIYPGEDEMEALALGALRVERKEDEVKIYK